MKKYLETQDLLNPYSKWLYLGAFLIALIPGYSTPYLVIMILGINIIVQFISIIQSKEFITMVNIKEEIVHSNLMLTFSIGILLVVISGLFELMRSMGIYFHQPLLEGILQTSRYIMRIIKLKIVFLGLKFIIETLLLDIITNIDKKYYTNNFVVIDLAIVLLLMVVAIVPTYSTIMSLYHLIFIVIVLFIVGKYYQNRVKLIKKKTIESIYFFLFGIIFLILINFRLFELTMQVTLAQLFVIVAGFVVYMIIIKVLEYALNNLINFERVNSNSKVVYPMALFALMFNIMLTSQLME